MRDISKAILALLLASSPVANAKEMESLAARVNDEPIKLSDYNKAKNAILSQYASVPGFLANSENIEKIEDMALDKMIDDALLRQKAESEKIKIYERELENRISEYRKQLALASSTKPLNAQQMQNAFRAELQKSGMTIEEFRTEVRNELMVKKLMQNKLRSKIKVPSDKEVKELFNNVMAYLKSEKLPAGIEKDDSDAIKLIAMRLKEATAERLRVRHVYCSFDNNTAEAAKEKAEKAYKALNSGKIDFDAAVEQYSEDTDTASRYGDIGYISKGMMPKEIEQAIFSLSVGANSKPIKTNKGWHIFRIEEKRAQQKARFNAVKDELSGFLSEKSYREEYAKYVKSLRKNAKVQKYIKKK